MKTTETPALSAEFLASRGVCCGSGCTNCPYQAKHIIGTSILSPQYIKASKAKIANSKVNS